MDVHDAISGRNKDDQGTTAKGVRLGLDSVAALFVAVDWESRQGTRNLSPGRALRRPRRFLHAVSVCGSASHSGEAQYQRTRLDPVLGSHIDR